MPGGGPVVTASCSIGEAPQLRSWLDQASSVEASTSTLSPIWEMPPILVPLCQHLLVRCLPHPHPTVLQGYETPAANMAGNKPGFLLLAYSRSSGNLLHTSGSPLRSRI